MPGILGRTYRRLAARPGYMLLVAGAGRVASKPPRRFRWGWLDLMFISAAWGAASALLWEGCAQVFDEYSAGLPFVPAAAVLSVMVLWLYRQSVLSLAEILGGAEPAGRAVAAALLVVVLAMILLGLRSWQPDWSHHLPTWLQWIRPRTMYRALFLAPLWGGWSMLITPQFRRGGGNTEPQVAEFARGCGPFLAAVCMAAPLAGSIVYFNHMPWTQLGISAVALLTAIVGGQIVCAVGGGLNRRNLLANNLLTQIAFLLAYLANR